MEGGGPVAGSLLLRFPAAGSEKQREVPRNAWAWPGLERRAALRLGGLFLVPNPHPSHLNCCCF